MAELQGLNAAQPMTRNCTCGVIPWLDIKDDHGFCQLSLLLSTLLGSLNNLHVRSALMSQVQAVTDQIRLV